MSDVLVGSRTPRAGGLQRKASVASRSDGATPTADAERSERSYDGYYGEDGWWEEEGYHFNSYDNSYYEEWHGEGGRQDDIIEVDLYSMVFVLDESLMPKDLYNGIELDDSSFMFTLEADDVAVQTPAAWRARPLKIHPEPPPANQRKEPGSGTPTRSGAATVDASTGNNTPTGGRTPRQKAATPPKVETPPPKDLPPPARLEPSALEDSEPSPDEALIDPGKTSAKIHISNRQLEHLKQKMQVLKQRRTSTPAEDREDKEKEKDPKEPEGSKEAEEPKAKEEAPKESKEKPEQVDTDAEIPSVSRRMEGKVHSNCPGAHGLSFFLTPETGWWCSVCEKEHVKGSGFYGCRQCDYDECQRCALTPQPASKEPKAAPAPESGNNSHAAHGDVNSRGNNSASKTPPPPRKGAEKRTTPAPSKSPSKKGSSNAASKASSSSSSSSSGESRSKSSSNSSPPRKKAKDAKKDKPEAKKKEANSKEKEKEKDKEKKEEKEKKEAKKADQKKNQAKRKATAKVKVKKTTKRGLQKPTKSASRSRSSENSDSNGEKEAKKKKKKNKNKKSAENKRNADPKLVPRKEPERWEPKRRKDEKEVSPPPKRKAERSRSRDTSPSARSEEAPPKKRAANALTVPTEPPRAPAVSLTRAAVCRSDDDKRSDEARWRQPAQEAARRPPQARDGQELLRRVLRAQLCPGKRAPAGRGTKDGEPRATLLPPSRKDASSEDEGASPPRGVATLRPPQDRAKKALDTRKPRRV